MSTKKNGSMKSREYFYGGHQLINADKSKFSSLEPDFYDFKHARVVIAHGNRDAESS